MSIKLDKDTLTYIVHDMQSKIDELDKQEEISVLDKIQINQMTQFIVYIQQLYLSQL